MTPTTSRQALAAFVGVVSICATTQVQAAECRYNIVVSDTMASELDVTIECDGGLPPAFVMTEGAPAWAGDMNLSDGSAVEPDGRRWLVPIDSRYGTAHYTLALRDMAATTGRYVGARRVHDSVFAYLGSWLARPDPTAGYTLSISFELAAGGDIATALPRDGERYRIAADDVSEAGETVFGTFERLMIDVPAPGALAASSRDKTTIDLVILLSPTDFIGRPAPTSPAQLAKWVEDSGRAVAEFWGGFPVKHPLLILAPGEGRRPTYGHVVSFGGITILVLVGTDAEPVDLYQYWSLIHEMLHLGSPFIRSSGPWLNEGIATFYEPIVRMRAGWKSRDEVWQEWIEWMPNGLRAMGEVGLAEAEGGGIYWGGALFLLLAEIEVRQRTDLALGIEDCLRAVRDAGGTADNKWTTQKFLDFCDETLGGTTLSDLAANHLGPGTPPDLDALWAELGVSMAEDGTITYDDSAPLAAVRDAILSGGPNAKWQPVPLRTE